MHVDAAVERFQGHIAHPVHELLAAEHPAGALRQRAEQVELVAGQRPFLAVDQHKARRAVDGQPAEAHDLVRRRPAAARAAAQDGAQPRQQLARVEGLGQVVVGADLQPDDPVGLLTGCRRGEVL